MPSKKPSKKPPAHKAKVAATKAVKPATPPPTAGSATAASTEAKTAPPPASAKSDERNVKARISNPSLRKGGKLSCLEAAAQVLKAHGQPMRCQEMIDQMAKKGLWKSTAPTPA